MKIRDGFVSNSSSSSFVVHLKDLTHEQIDIILDANNHLESDNWNIYYNHNKDTITGYTVIDNDELKDYLNSRNICLCKFEFEDDY